MSFLYLSLALLPFILSTAVLFLLYLLGSLTPAIALAFISTVAVLLITSVLIGYRIGFQEKYDTLERFVSLYYCTYSQSVPCQPVDTIPPQPVDTIPPQPVDTVPLVPQPVDTVPHLLSKCASTMPGSIIYVLYNKVLKI